MAFMFDFDSGGAVGDSEEPVPGRIEISNFVRDNNTGMLFSTGGRFSLNRMVAALRVAEVIFPPVPKVTRTNPVAD
jgi:hypothetical protein